MIPLYAYMPKPGEPPEEFLGLAMVLWAPVFWTVCCLIAVASLVMTCFIQNRRRYTLGCAAFVVVHPYLWLSPSWGDGGHFQCDASWFLIPYPITLLLIQLVMTFSSRTAPAEPPRRYNSP